MTVTTGTPGNDTLTGDDCFLNVIFGLEGNDKLTATGALSFLFGGAGNDVILSGNGLLDVLIGGEGSDTISYEKAKCAVTVDLNKTLQYTGGSGFDFIKGFEDIIGSNYNDTLTGDAGNNRLIGGTGADKMTGGLGNDTYSVDNVGDKVIEKAGEGTEIVLSTIDYTLGANLENLAIFNSAIRATGNALNNIIAGNAMDNILNGKEGSDTLFGGAGKDIFVFDKPEVGVIDKINDFASGVDKIGIVGAGFGLAPGALAADYFVKTSGVVSREGINNHSTTAAHGQFVQDFYNNLYWDADGSGAGNAVLVSGLGAGTLYVNDFIVL